LPELGNSCGKYHSFRDFIECGETQTKTDLTNIPEQLETYGALSNLAVNIIDPVMDYFGGIELTYGFCSRELAKFDRLYFYGNELPIHVSYGEEHNRSIVIMKTSANGRLYPAVVKRKVFLFGKFPM